MIKAFEATIEGITYEIHAEPQLEELLIFHNGIEVFPPDHVCSRILSLVRDRFIDTKSPQ